MDISHHEKTWLAFWAGTKWAAIVIIFLVVILAIFRTNG
jgi:fumarate reductase subunit D